MQQIKPGDVIGFSGRGLISSVIKVGTFASPWSGISHVGVVAQARGHGELVFESTSLDELPCSVSGVRGPGVQAHAISELVDSYDGAMYNYPLYRELYRHESSRLTSYLLQAIGRQYDKNGALHAGGMLYATVSAMKCGQDLAELFCSELVAAALSNIGVFETTNASRWNPTRLIRELRRLDIIGKPVRLK
jgi:hypothetical protein